LERLAKYLGFGILVLLLCSFASATSVYNQQIEPTLIIKYDASSNTAIRASPTVSLDFDFDSYDLFNETATAGDYIVWVWDRAVWNNLTINISTPINSTPITFNSSINNALSSTLMDWAEPPAYDTGMVGGTVLMTSGTYNGSSATANGGGVQGWSGPGFPYFFISSGIAETGASFNFTVPSFEIIWEYRNAGGWQTLPNVTDNSHNFTTSGLVNINFPIPPDWDVTSGTGIGALNVRSSGVMVRARIVSTGNLTEGGHVTGHTTIDDNTITIEDEDYRLEDLWEDDLANNWSCMHKFNSYYSIMCNLAIITSNLTIRDYEMLEIGNDTYHKTIFQEDTSSIFQIGYKDSNGARESSYLKYWNHNGIQRNPYGGYNIWSSTVRLYSSSFVKYWGGFNDPAISGKVDLENSQMETMQSSTWYFTSTSSGNITNVAFKTGTWPLYLYSDEMAVNNLIFSYMPKIVGGVKGVILENIDFGSDKQFQIANSNAYVYAVNSHLEDFEYQTYPTSTNTTGFIQYDLDLTVLNKSGIDIGDFNVTLVNALGETVFNDTYTEPIRTTVYKEVNVPTSSTNYNPMELTISKEGFVDIYSKFNLTNDNRKITVTMGAYPFIINGSLRLKAGEQVKVYRCD